MNDEHAELSPSSAERWLNCTASVAFCKGVVDEGSVYASEGTDAHTALELWNDLGVPPLDGEMYYQLLPTHEYALKLIADGFDVKFEQRVTYSDRYWGTADILATKGKTLLVDDYKHGYVPVEAKNNPQLLSYALCAEKTLESKFSNITVSIHQPRIAHRDGAIRPFEISREKLDWFELEVVSAIRRIDDGDVTFMPGKWCRYCPRSGDCIPATNFFGKLLTGSALI